MNFGAPGGLGPKKLADYARKTYGVIWTPDQAFEMRRKFLEVYPDIDEFLKRHKTSLSDNLMRASGRSIDYWMAKMGTKTIMELREAMAKSNDRFTRETFYAAERSLTIRLRTGFVRKGCSFTEGSNTHFQGLAAHVTKQAAWLFFSSDSARNIDARPILLVHDEILAECPPDYANDCAQVLEDFMLEAFRDVCPDTGPFAKVEVEAGLLRWGKATDKEGKPV